MPGFSDKKEEHVKSLRVPVLGNKYMPPNTGVSDVYKNQRFITFIEFPPNWKQRVSLHGKTCMTQKLHFSLCFHLPQLAAQQFSEKLRQGHTFLLHQVIFCSQVGWTPKLSSTKLKWVQKQVYQDKGPVHCLHLFEYRKLKKAQIWCQPRKKFKNFALISLLINTTLVLINAN